MTSIKTTVPSLRPYASSAPVAQAHPAPSRISEVQDGFERAPTRQGPTIAWQPVAAAAALMMNIAALTTGVTNSLTGWDSMRSFPRPSGPRTEIIRRPPGGV